MSNKETQSRSGNSPYENNLSIPEAWREKARSFYEGKRLLVIGGTGSVGGLIVRELLRLDPAVVRILSRDETKQLEFKEALASGHPALQEGQKVEVQENIRFLIGDIRNQERLERAMRGVDVVIQAAALKHVDSCEYNPFEAVRTNVIGTEHVIDAAIRSDVDSLLGISTDKAISPPYVMGATKLLSEKLLTSVNRWATRPVSACVRFGNVLGSRGSVVPMVMKQIERGGPVKLTDPDMRRYYITREQAAMLVLESAQQMEGGEIYFYTMPVLNTRDLLEVLVEEYAPLQGYDPGDITIETVGRRPGEKINERIVTREERSRAGTSGPIESGEENSDSDIFLPEFGKVIPFYRWSEEEDDLETHGLNPLSEAQVYTREGNPIDKEEIRTLLRSSIPELDDPD